MIEVIGWIIVYSSIVCGALSDSRIALIACLLFGPILSIMFIGGLIVCISEVSSVRNNGY